MKKRKKNKQSNIRLFSYVVAIDSGFAPNPEKNICSLACCKPGIRKYARENDWVIGTGSANTVGKSKLVYAMQISKPILFDDYYRDKRFRSRKDNIYFLTKHGYRQKDNKYHKKSNMKRDLSCKNVLLSKKYYYFGDEAISIDKKYRAVIKKGPGYKNKLDPKLVSKFISWVKKYPKKGKISEPYDIVLASKTIKCI